METKLEYSVRMIMDRALGAIAREFANAPPAEIAGAFAAMNAAAATNGAARGARANEKAAAAKGAQAVKPARKPISRDQITERVVIALRGAQKPLGLSDLAKRTHLDAAQIQPSVKALKDSGRVVKHGDKRTTVYTMADETHDVSDPTGDRHDEPVTAAEPEASPIEAADPDVVAASGDAPAAIEVVAPGSPPPANEGAEGADTTNRYKRKRAR